MFSDLRRSSRNFFQFLGIHSFLVGLFPFFLPVFLWKQGYDLSSISLFISITGLGFILSLWSWDRLHKKYSLKYIISLSFVVEILLMSWIFATGHSIFLPILALLNGAYNCFFWITQRALFFETLAEDNAGRKVGNFQIYVVVTLKLGVFCGGLLLEYGGFGSLYVLSLLMALSGMLSFLQMRSPPQLPDPLVTATPLSFKDLLGFRDRRGSRSIFLLDGPFLFLESYFWMISLFLISHQSFWKLGLLVIILGVSFSLLFFIIKNRIDTMPKQRIYMIGVGGYTLSWLLRSISNDQLPLFLLFLLLVTITFLTSFFRLAFNKRFFDLAKAGTAHRYLFLKSYYSQFSISLAFGAAAWIMHYAKNPATALTYSYLIAAVLALAYLLYRPVEHTTKP